jgi:hypothetical protein
MIAKPEMIPSRRGPVLAGTKIEAVTYVVAKFGPLRVRDLDELMPLEFPGIDKPTSGWACSMQAAQFAGRVKRIARGLFAVA